MMQNSEEKEYSLRFLIVRAAVVILAVVAVLVALHAAGVTVREKDVPPTVVEEITREGTAPSAAEAPQTNE